MPFFGFFEGGANGVTLLKFGARKNLGAHGRGLGVGGKGSLSVYNGPLHWGPWSALNPKLLLQ